VRPRFACLLSRPYFFALFTLLVVAHAHVAHADTREDLDLDAYEHQVLDRINAYRISLRLAVLVDVPRLNAVAYAHSLDMAHRRYFGHIDPDGHTPFDRLASAGYDADDEGENLAAGYPDAERTFQQWRHSRSHDEAMRDPAYRAIGIGRVESPSGRQPFYWTVLFGNDLRPCDFDRASIPPPAAWRSARGPRADNAVSHSDHGKAHEPLSRALIATTMRRVRRHVRARHHDSARSI
jgi:hypothetical protein